MIFHNSKTVKKEPNYVEWLKEHRELLPDVAFADKTNKIYPHHVILESGEMVLSKQGLMNAWTLALNGGKVSSDITAHLENHRKDLGIGKSDKLLKEGLMAWMEIKHPIYSKETKEKKWRTQT